MVNIGFSQEMKMQHSLAPQLYQSLEILQMPIMDLQNLIKQELTENPTLEMSNNNTDENIEVESGTFDQEQFDMEISSYEVDNNNNSTPSDLSEKYQYMIDSLVESVTLQNHLLQQLNEHDLNEREKNIAELIIGNIDDDGYLTLNIEELLDTPNFPEKDFSKILTLIQSFEPYGVCARNLKECLLIQLQHKNMKDSDLYILVSKYMDLLGKNQLEKISENMNISLNDVKKLTDTIKLLDPKPGQLISSKNSEYIIPEVYIEKDDDDNLIVKANEKPYPKLFISQKYISMLKDKSVTKETKKYIREKLSKSKLMIKSIDQRLSIVEQVASEILQIQYSFFNNDSDELIPLNMKRIAEKLDVHETTVSRATSDKYIKTSRGIFEMKYFFNPAVPTISGRIISNQFAKNVLSEIISDEDKKKPYSDSRLSELLKERDILISRRTVAKYRDQLNILSSSLRRKI